MSEIRNRWTKQIIAQDDTVGLRELTERQKMRLTGAELSGADLRGANLSRANLSRANLSRAELSGAELSGADLSGADLSLAELSGAELSGAICNSSSHDLATELLCRSAGNDLQKRMVAGLVLVSRDWCQDEFRATMKGLPKRLVAWTVRTLTAEENWGFGWLKERSDE